jgi:hypothetical protein
MENFAKFIEFLLDLFVGKSEPANIRRVVYRNYAAGPYDLEVA